MTFGTSLARAAGALLGMVWLGAAPALSQSPSPSTPASAAGPTLAAGFSALDAGRFDEATRIARALIDQSPLNQGAVLLQISALAYGRNPKEAVDAYDAWRSRQRADNPFLLVVVGEGVARHLATHAEDSALRIAAAELLVTFGAAGAKALLAAAAGATGPAGTAALARAGDAAAAQRAAARLSGLQGSAKATAIGELAGASDPELLAKVAALSADPDPMVRASVADVLGGTDAVTALPVLERLLQDPTGQVKQAAAVALVRRGDARGEAIVESMLASGVGDLVLQAAEALPASSARWISRVQPLLESDDPVERLRAASLLKDVAPEAGSVLREALASQNVALRDEAARLAARGLPLGGGDWRQMLNDPNGWLQLAAARALMEPASAPL